LESGFNGTKTALTVGPLWLHSGNRNRQGHKADLALTAFSCFSNIPSEQVVLEPTLYIETRRAYTPKGDREKIYLVCYPALGKKETSCKEIRVSSTKLKF
jgi:hypothetical protein